MPTTEVPTSPPPGAPPEPPRFKRANRYEDYETHDLLSVIEELEGDRNWASLREKVWIAIIIHMIVLWILMYGPKYILHQQVRVINPAEKLEREKQMTYLETPRDIKPMKPTKPAPAISNEDHRAQTPHPTLDKKTLEELEAMRRAGLPAPKPAPQQAQPQPAPAQQPPQQQAAQQPKTPAQPLPANEKSQIEAPKPAPTKPSFNTGPMTPGQEIQQMARNATRSGQSGGDMGAGAPSDHPGENGAVDILSDTMGVDFGPYIERVIYDTKKAWYPIIPEEAQPPLLKQGRVMIRFKIGPDGSVIPHSMVLESGSQDVPLDKAAWASITYAGYPPLPKEFKGPYLELRFMFLYNIRPGDE
jgi:outer membrane biosynthesis protein TonB